MWPDWVPDLGPLAPKSDGLPTALRGPTAKQAIVLIITFYALILNLGWLRMTLC